MRTGTRVSNGMGWDDDDIGFPFFTCRSFSTNRVDVPYVPYTNVPGFSHEYSIASFLQSTNRWRILVKQIRALEKGLGSMAMFEVN